MVKLTCKFPTIYNVSLTVLKHYLLDFNWRTVNVLPTKLGIKIVRKPVSYTHLTLPTILRV